MDDNSIFIDRDTSFNGTITAKKVTVEGFVEGDVTASDMVFIRKGGIINGDIRTQKLLCEEGSKHRGEIQLGKESLTEEIQSQPASTQYKEQQKDEPQKVRQSSATKKKQTEKSTQLW